MMVRLVIMSLGLASCLWTSDTAAAKDAAINNLSEIEVRPIQRSTTDVFSILTRLISADKNFAAGIYHKSYADYAAVILHDPAHKAALLGLGNSALAIGKNDDALIAFKTLGKMDLSPENNRAQFIGLALAEVQSGLIEDPEQRLKTALEIAPDDPRLYNGLARIYEHEARWSESWSAYQKAYEAGDSEANFHNNLGLSLLRQQKYKGAASHFDYAKKLKPKQAQYNRHHRFALLLDGQYTQALQDIPEDKAGEFLGEAGRVALSREDYPIARRLLEKAIDISPRYNQRAAQDLEKLASLGE